AAARRPSSALAWPSDIRDENDDPNGIRTGFARSQNAPNPAPSRPRTRETGGPEDRRLGPQARGEDRRSPGSTPRMPTAAARRPISALGVAAARSDENGVPNGIRTGFARSQNALNPAPSRLRTGET